MIERVRELAYGSNDIGAFVTLSCWVMPTGYSRNSGGRAAIELASPREITQAQIEMKASADRRLGVESYVASSTINLAVGYSEFDTVIQQVDRLKKTRIISFE